MKIICIRKNICSHGKKNLLFLPSNMAAVQNLYSFLFFLSSQPMLDSSILSAVFKMLWPKSEASLCILYQICPEMHVIRCMAISISVTKCPVARLVNLIITSGETYGR